MMSEFSLVSRHLNHPAETLVHDRITRGIQAMMLTRDACVQDITVAADAIIQAFQNGNKLMLCGNGGSAAECQHMSAELVHRLSASVIRRALPAISLTTDTSFLTACANDDGFNLVFQRQVEAIGVPGDVLLGLSTSGSSPNLLAAFLQAQTQGIHTIAMCGMSGPLAEIADTSIRIPVRDSQSIQECHLPVIHILCALIERPFVTSEHGS